MPLELFSRSPRIHNTPVFHTAKDQSYIPTTKIVQEKVLDHKITQLTNITESLKQDYPAIFWNVKLGTVQESLNQIQNQFPPNLSLINQHSSDHFINEWFGTLETELIKNTNRPVLLIPNGKPYHKPEKLLILIRDLPKIPTQTIKKLQENFNLNLCYAFVEEQQTIELKDIMQSLNKDFKHFIGSINKFSIKYSGDHLDQIMDRERPDWVSFINFDRRFFDRLTKLNTNKLLLSSKLPCLAI